MAIANPQSFRSEARYQRVCAVTGKGGGFLAHHVVYKQVLRSRCGLRGDALYDTRNALRLCRAAHDNHHSRARVIRTCELTDENISYAFEVLGAYAADYLRRFYDDSEPEPMIERELRARMQA